MLSPSPPPIFIKVCKKKVLGLDSSRRANLPQLNGSQESAVFGVFLALVLCSRSLRFLKARKELSVGQTAASPGVLAGGWCSLGSLSLWARRHVWFFHGVIPHSTRELPFEGSQVHQTPLQLSSQPRGPSALGARGMEGSGGGVSAASRGSRVKHPAREKAPGAAGGPPNDLISESQRGSSPLSAAGFVQPGFGHPSAHQPPVHGGGGRTAGERRSRDRGGQAWSQPQLRGYLAGQGDGRCWFFSWPPHRRVASEPPAPPARSVGFQFPPVWPSSPYHLTGSE